jgi:hypothetical protein
MAAVKSRALADAKELVLQNKIERLRKELRAISVAD